MNKLDLQAKADADELIVSLWEQIGKIQIEKAELRKERDEARAAFDAAMEYADSAYCDRCAVENSTHECGLMEFDKPRPIAPWEK